jgi:hypothetical protein
MDDHVAHSPLSCKIEGLVSTCFPVLVTGCASFWLSEELANASQPKLREETLNRVHAMLHRGAGLVDPAHNRLDRRLFDGQVAHAVACRHGGDQRGCGGDFAVEAQPGARTFAAH